MKNNYNPDLENTKTGSLEHLTPARKIMRITTIASLSILSLFTFPVVAEEKDSRSSYNIIPIAVYNQFSAGRQSVQTPGLGLVVKNDSDQYIATYQKSLFNERPLFHVPMDYHAINFLGDLNHKPYNTLLIFKSQSDQPVNGGLRTYQLGVAGGYTLIERSHASLILGGGIAVGDFGLAMSNGKPLPLIPVPLVRYQNKWEWLELKFEFLTGPNLSLSIFPDQQWRLTADVRMDNFRDSGDILFESILWYRFFEASHEYGDFAGIGLGLKRDELAFDLAYRSESFAVQYNSAFVTLDFSVLKISFGSTFNAVERHGDEFQSALGSGNFAEIQLLYQF